jgi:hypothetical protein
MTTSDPLRARFDAEVEVAELAPSAADREPLFVMWRDFLPYREQLRSAPVEPEEEPSFIEKPCQPGGGA